MQFSSDCLYNKINIDWRERANPFIVHKQDKQICIEQKTIEIGYKKNK